MEVYLQVDKPSTSGSEGAASTLSHCWDLSNQNSFRSQRNKLTSKISDVVTTSTAVNVTAGSEYVCGVTTFRDKHVLVQVHGSGLECLQVRLLSFVNDMMLFSG